jgi:hypothetical protein
MHIANVSAQHSFFKKALVAQVGVKNLFNLQNSTLTGSVNPQSSGHLSAGAMQAFPARSFFIDVTYSL